MSGLSTSAQAILQEIRGIQAPETADDLPVPSTSRTLPPRGISRSSGGSVSGSRPASRSSSIQARAALNENPYPVPDGSGTRSDQGPMVDEEAYPSASSGLAPASLENLYHGQETSGGSSHDVHVNENMNVDYDLYDNVSYEPDQSWWEPYIPFDDEASGQYGENSAENMDSSTRDIPDTAVAEGSGAKRKRSSSPSDDPPGPSHVYHPDEDSTSQGSSIDHKGKGKAREETPPIIDIPDSPHSAGKAKEIPKKAGPEPLSEYTCPICFGPPMNATLTPCGHISCGSCLFAAVKSALQRATYAGPGMNEARCPVCRAVIPGWDGKGAGVIGLKPRAIFRI